MNIFVNLFVVSLAIGIDDTKIETDTLILTVIKLRVLIELIEKIKHFIFSHGFISLVRVL